MAGRWLLRYILYFISFQKSAAVKVYEGSKFLYDLPVNGIAANLTMISGPLGSTLSESSLTWSSTTGGNVRTEKFIIGSESECGNREQFVLEVEVERCECENNGVCSIDTDGVQCICTQGYHGKFSV